MRLVTLHNVLYTTARLIDAEAAALKLLPEPGAVWEPLDVAVGDTSQLGIFAWREGAAAPEPNSAPTRRELFGVADALKLFVAEDARRAAVRIDVSESLLNAMPGQFTSQDRRSTSGDQFGTLWLGFAFESAADLTRYFERGDAHQPLVDLLLGVGTQAVWGLYQSTRAHADPVTGLPGPMDFHNRLRRGCNHGRGVALALLGVDDYTQQRRQFGHEHAENLLGLVARQLEAAVRKEDGVFRYSEALFAVVADTVDAAGAEQLAEKLVAALARTSALNDTASSVGYVYVDGDSTPDASDPQAVCLCAEQALDHARLLGGSQAVAFSGTFDDDEIGAFRSEGGLLTADPARDYRNSHILWQTISLVAAETEPTELCGSFATLLQERLGATEVLLLTATREGFQDLSASEAPVAARLSIEQQRFVRLAIDQRKTQRQHDDTQVEQWLAIPLVSRGELYGCLFLESVVRFDAADVVFLKALAEQIAGALDRAALARVQIEQSAKESEALREELSDLRKHLPQPKLTVDSTRAAAMRSVLDYISRIAPTDVSVLIFGESGAGKEVVARTIHEASARSTAPFVTVDCGTIAHSLIDSELFGRVKGAFTGADEASAGRIAQADGGTLFLDEIGELPMDVQVKLLRFVQEKEIIAVGDTRIRTIDARIICATNRNLREEVNAGRFRGDLFYRLQVIQVNVPPLRERLEDLPPLVEYFIARFSGEFQRDVVGLTEQAWRKVNEYGWPGNVRELQNTLLRAVLLAEDANLDAHDLQLEMELSSASSPPAQSVAPAVKAANPLLANDAEPNTNAPVDRLTELSNMLAQQVAALQAEAHNDAPLGRWLADTVVLTAIDLTDGVVLSAAGLLGVPETTLRRQLKKARQNADNPFQVTSQTWVSGLPDLKAALAELMRDATVQGGLAEYCQSALLRQVSQAVGDDHRTGAALMDITPPTYARWLVKYQIPSCPAQSPAAPAVDRKAS